MVAIPAIMAGALGVGVVGGAAVGAAAVVPEVRAAAIERAVDTVVAGLRLPELTAGAVATDISEVTRYRAEVIEGEGPTSKNELPSYRLLRERGFGGGH